jgi:hypothetical protein
MGRNQGMIVRQIPIGAQQRDEMFCSIEALAIERSVFAHRAEKAPICGHFWNSV